MAKKPAKSSRNQRTDANGSAPTTAPARPTGAIIMEGVTRAVVAESLARWQIVAEAATIRDASGEWRVAGPDEARLLSDATDDLGNKAGSLFLGLTLPSLSKVGDGVHAGWVSLTPELTRELRAALLAVMRAVSFSPERWNAAQAARPGGPHRRWVWGDTVPAEVRERIDQARRLLDIQHIVDPPSTWKSRPTAERAKAAMAALTDQSFQLPSRKKDFFDLYGLNRGQVNRDFTDLDAAYRKRVEADRKRRREVVKPGHALAEGIHPRATR